MKSMPKVQDLWLRIGWLLLAALIVSGSRDLFLRGIGTGNGEFLGVFSFKWGIGLIGYGLIALSVVLFCIYGFLLPRQVMGWFQNLEQHSIRKKFISWVIAVGSFLFPLFFLLGPWGWRFDLPHFRVMLLVSFSILAGIFFPQKYTNWLERSAVMILLSATCLLLVQRFMMITDYPFATSWSEGNRLWDYSLYFGRDRYIFNETFSYPSYLTPGRHGLWGLPFLFLSNPSIVVMRVWDAILWTFTYLLLGVTLFVGRKPSLRSPWQWAMVLWTFLFLSQGPIYAPLIISGIVLALGYRRRHLWLSLIVTAIACFYAGISRWTWMVAPAAWAVLWAFLDEDIEQGFWKRIQHPVFLGLAGMLGAILSMVVMNVAFPRPDPIYSTSLRQPLLWYRLWSNPTNPTGVVRGLLYVAGPVLIWLIWMIIRQKARWDVLKIIALLGVLMSFLAAGLVASVKIGGGSNIHNLDMFLVSLVFIVAMIVGSKETLSRFSGLSWALFGFMLLIPVWNLTRYHEELEIPEDSNPDAVIAEMQTIIGEAAKEGEVLFIDQRQLLTFGEIKDVPLVMEYEVKDMMNQAMGHNRAYFEKFREDIENQRFRLIVSDPLFVVYQGSKVAFGEENDAWVEEVTIPILSAYEPVMKFNEHLIWLLAPKDRSED
jgi:hypothetical protein